MSFGIIRLGQQPTDDLNLDELRDQLKSSELLTCSRAMFRTNSAIPHTEPLLPDLYSLYRTTASAAIRCHTYNVISNHNAVAVPFLLSLLESSDAFDRRTAVDLLGGLGRARSGWRVVEHILKDRPGTQPDWGLHRDIVLRGI